MTKRLTIALVALAMFVLVAVMPASAAFYVVNTSIHQGATVFIGEQGLDLTPAQAEYAAKATTSVGPATTIGWWASAANIGSSAPTATFALGATPTNTLISYSAFGSYYGPWYNILPNGFGDFTNGSIITVKDPQLSVDVWDINQGTQGGISVSGKSVIQGDNLTFKIGTNMDTAISQGQLRQLGGLPVKGNMDIKVKTEQGNTFTQLLNVSNIPNALTNQFVNTPAWYWGTTGSAGADRNWSTSATDSTGQAAYPAGTYTITVQSMLNNMYDNYQLGGAAYTGKTLSEAKTVTIVSNTVKITANKDSVVRSKPFSITITGRPNTNYHVWVKGTTSMTGGWDSQPPLIAPYQLGVFQDVNLTVGTTSVADLQFVDSACWYNVDNELPAGVITASRNAGGYNFQNSGSWVAGAANSGGSIWANVAHGSSAENIYKLGNGTALYANVTMADAGTRTVEFMTTNWTKAQKYTIHVENNFGTTTSPVFKSDEVDVKVEKGAVTIVAAGDQSYYLGEEIKFSGTNTETQTTYLFISGPNLDQYGSQINVPDPRTAANAVTGHESALQTASVLGDNTWSWKWGTAAVALDAGTYTVWATSQPSNSAASNLEKCSYGTVSIVLKKPFISATATQSTVAQGDKITIVGTAEGSPSVGVEIWILGKNYATVTTKAVNSDSTFSYEVARTSTTNLAPGQYFVVAQHPMQNNMFDVYPANTNVMPAAADTATPTWVINRQLGNTGTAVFRLLGQGSLQGSDAAEALVQAINDPNVDDTYTKLQFLVENPTITITPVGDRHVGDKFTIASTTNLAVDDEVLCQVYSSSFKPTQKTQSGEFSGASATVKVAKGTSGLNTISFPIDASTFKPDEYIVQEDGVLVAATGTALFNVLEGAAPTAVPTVVVTTAAPTTVVTTVPPTTVATPTKTPTQPGFGALVALIGLGAVAFLVVRRH